MGIILGIIFGVFVGYDVVGIFNVGILMGVVMLFMFRMVRILMEGLILILELIRDFL